MSIRGCSVAVVAVAMVMVTAAYGADVTVQYLRAAIGSIPDRSRVDFIGDYVVADGLKEARGTYLRGKGYSRFSAKAPDAEISFDSVYCKQESDAFETLIAARRAGRYHFYGYKERGEDREDAIIVTDAKPVAVDESARLASRSDPASYRIVMVDNVTSNKTVLTNIEIGKAYNVMGSTLLLEREPPVAPGAPKILR